MSISSLNPNLHGKKRLPALTSLRIFAAMHVVLFHCARTIAARTADHLIALTSHSPSPLHWTVFLLGKGLTNFLNAGPWSVSLFFILSGFILVYNYGGDRESSLDSNRFWIARFARIYPVYLLGLIIIAPFVFHRWYATHEYGIHTILTGGILSIILLQSWVPKYATFWNVPAWSMSVEAFFYALFPLLLLPLRRCSRPAILIATILGCWLLSILKNPFVWTLARHWWGATGASEHSILIGDITDYSPICRLPEFVAGMALGRLMLIRGGPTLRGFSLATLALLSGGLCLLIAALGPDCPWYFAAAGGLTPLFALLIWSLTVEDSFVATILAWSPFVFFGEVSYTVYIIHLPLAHWFGVIINHLTHRPIAETVYDIPSYPILLIYIVALLSLCSLIYLTFELPARDHIRRGLGRYFKSRPAPAQASAGSR